MTEIVARLGDPARRAKMPATGLMNFANSWMRILERREVVRPPAPGEFTPILDAIASSGLPDERRLFLLRQEFGRLRARREEMLSEMAELQNAFEEILGD